MFYEIGKIMKNNEIVLKEKGYQLLADCIRSDQLSARQVQEELEADPEFKKWYIKRYIH